MSRKYGKKARYELPLLSPSVVVVLPLRVSNSRTNSPELQWSDKSSEERRGDYTILHFYFYTHARTQTPVEVYCVANRIAILAVQIQFIC